MNLRVLAAATGLIIATLVAGTGVCAPHSDQQPSTRHRSVPSHMPETDRTSITSLAIVPAADSAISGVGGDYKRRWHVLDGAWIGAYYGEQIGLLKNSEEAGLNLIFGAHDQVKMRAAILGADAISFPLCKKVTADKRPKGCRVQLSCRSNAFKRGGATI